ncbi:polyprenyl synthetase family protein [Streptomyces vietnamensis]|uniref:polyprenyl synthetase family protein n=1 Tax=Streptomyces vietnamensis TaxID=362257 RepID=UPI0037A726B3
MCTLDPRSIDRDVPAALNHVIDELLRRRVAEARAVEGTFAADIAGRVAAFAAGGGRRRSQLLWWSMRAVGGGADEAEAALRVGAAVELIQTCALIHDDVMDGSRLRRGSPSVHVALDRQYGTDGLDRPPGGFGGSGAVLAGDLALVWADDAFTEALLTTPHSAGLGAQWRAMRTEMVAGQYLDLQTQATGSRSVGRAMRTAVLKTAQYSAVHPLLLGARLAGAGERTLRGLGRAGLCAGIAFQLQNDLQGVFGDPRRTGKSAGEDLRTGKATYLMAVARALCVRGGDTEGLRFLDAVVGSPAATERELRRVIDLLESCGARAHVAGRAERLCARAVRTLRQTELAPGPAGHVTRLLLDAGGVVLSGADSGGDAEAGGDGVGGGGPAGAGAFTGAAPGRAVAVSGAGR